jgi:nucleotidyltransferase/DNA polymerase involved in DNA repair
MAKKIVQKSLYVLVLIGTKKFLVRFKRFLWIYRFSRALVTDEAYLDVTHNKKGNLSATLLTRNKTTNFDEVGLTASAGISVNKFVAKIASDFNKPNGQNGASRWSAHSWRNYLFENFMALEKWQLKKCTNSVFSLE